MPLLVPEDETQPGLAVALAAQLALADDVDRVDLLAPVEVAQRSPLRRALDQWLLSGFVHLPIQIREGRGRCRLPQYRSDHDERRPGRSGSDGTGRDPSRSAGRSGIRVASRLDAPPQAVWERIATEAGINDEMRPIMRMRFPGAHAQASIPRRSSSARRSGAAGCCCSACVPFEYDELTLVRLEPGRGFHERSRMLSQRLWEHERTLEPSGAGGCLITDRVLWEPRLGLPGAPASPADPPLLRPQAPPPAAPLRRPTRLSRSCV